MIEAVPLAVATGAVVALVLLHFRHVRLRRRLEALARTDELTGLPNRRAWRESLERELSRAQRLGTPLAVALVDLDRFKRLNDTDGHQAGDRLLKAVAARSVQRLR